MRNGTNTSSTPTFAVASSRSAASAVPSFSAQAGTGPDRLRPGPVLRLRGRVLELAAKARTRGPRRVDEARDAVRKTVAQLRGLLGGDCAGGLRGRDLRLGVRGERGDEAVSGLARGRSGDLREGLAGLHLGAQVSGGGAEVGRGSGEGVADHATIVGSARTTAMWCALLIDERREVRLLRGHKRLDEPVAGLAVGDGDVGEALGGAELVAELVGGGAVVGRLGAGEVAV